MYPIKSLWFRRASPSICAWLKLSVFCRWNTAVFIRLWFHLTWQSEHRFELITAKFRGSNLRSICERSEKKKKKKLRSALIGCSLAHQVGAEHEEADEVKVGQVTAAGELFAGLNISLWVTASAGQGAQHDLLPLLSSSTPIRPEVLSKIQILH